MTTIREIIIAGCESLTDTGAFTAWRGSGKTTVAALRQIARLANVPAEHYPRPKSAIAIAGRVLRELCASGYIVRRVRKGGNAANWRARWTVALQAGNAEVGESAGKIILTAELSSEWAFTMTALRDTRGQVRSDAAALEAQLATAFDSATDSEIYTAADTSAWISSVLRNNCGSVKLGQVWYIPPASRQGADQFLDLVSSYFGDSWMYPLIPVATTDELCASIGSAFDAEVADVAERIHASTVDTKAGKMRSSTAAKYVVELSDLIVRADAYAMMVGSEVTDDARARLRLLRDQCATISGDSDLRFAGLELDGGPTASEPETRPESPAERAVEHALAERRAANSNVVDTAIDSAIDETVTAALDALLDTEPEPEPTIDEGAWERFSLLELD